MSLKSLGRSRGKLLKTSMSEKRSNESWDKTSLRALSPPAIRIDSMREGNWIVIPMKSSRMLKPRAMECIEESGVITWLKKEHKKLPLFCPIVQLTPPDRLNAGLLVLHKQVK